MRELILRHFNRFLTAALLAFLSVTPQAFSSDSPCFSERSCTATTLGAQSSALEKGCELTRAANCSDIKDQDKLYTCDVKSFCARTSLDTAIAGAKGCGLGVLSGTGIKQVFEVLKGLAQFATYSSGCNTDIEQKLDMIDRFNDALPAGENFKTPPAQSLNRMSCSDLLKEFNTKAYNVSQRMTERSAADVSKEINPGRNTQNKVDLKAAAEKLLDQLKVRRECYNTKALAELYCEAGTVVVMTAAGGYTAFRAARLAKLAKLSDSVQVEAAVARSIRSVGGATEGLMATASGLSDTDRLGVAKVLLGRNLSKAEQDAIIAAHNVGKQREGAGFFEYTEQELRDKARLLRRADFNSHERDVLMRNGIAGSSADSSAIKASMQQTKTFKALSGYEKETRLKTLDQRDHFLKQVESQSYRYSTMTPAEKREYLGDVRGLAEMSRVAGQSAASVGDLASGQALTKEALARYERVLKDAPQILNSPSDRETVLQMKIRAGDSEGAAKMLVENAKLDYEADGLQNAAAAMNERFQKLKESAEAGPSKFVLSNERGGGRYISTGQSIAPTNASSGYLTQMQELKTLDKIIESKPNWLVNFDYSRERARIQSLLEGVKRELRNRGYNPDQL